MLLVCSQLYAQNTPLSSARPVVTPMPRPPVYTNNIVNYVRTWEPSMPTGDPATVIGTGRTVAEIKQGTQYVDGLGRPLQAVSKGITPMGKDIVTPVVYDAFGREQFKYLPYAAPGSDGKFKTNPFLEQATFMSSQFPGERIYYDETQFEDFPINRIRKATGPGDNWTGKARGVGQQYLVNTVADAVRIWKVQDNDIRPQSIGTYNEAELYKNITIDERGNKAVEFKDKEGMVILKKVELTGNAADGHNDWLCTYYVYDDLNLLRCVIPPKAVSLIKSSWSITPDIAKELCFFYRYDARNRMVMKQLPGVDSVEMVYDKRDRLVFTQDANLRKNSPAKWLVTFYDILNRPVMTALYNSSESRTTLQTGMNAANGATTISYIVPYVSDLTLTSHDGRSRYEARNSITFNNGFDSGNGASFETLLDANGNQYNINVTANNPLPNLQQAQLTPLTYTFYDQYNYDGVHAAFTEDFDKPEKGPNLYSEPNVGTSNMTNGMITGTKVRILGTNDWLTTTNYYNDKGRLIQTISDNAIGGKDIITNLYDFNGKLLSNYRRHKAPRSNLTPETPVLTMLTYDAGGRIDSVKKRLNNTLSLQRTIAKNTYDELGKLKTKRLNVTGTNTQLETLTYEYNIRGWLRGINKSFVNTAGSSINWFGQELNYDSGFVANQYNGNIAGTKWKSRTSGIPRAYGFAYDSVNRLTTADYSQQNTVGALWTKNTVDFTVNGLTYDDNGNIGQMNQQGMDGTTIVALDKLIYGYKANSNKLDSIKDTSPVSTKLGDFKNGTNSGIDYDYDYNGNLKLDRNKNISAISYNHLNLPENIVITNKGSIKYLYDATGNKLRKTVTDNTFTPAKVTVTDYVGGFVYENDTLQFLQHEEGRIRVVYVGGQPPAYWYDYFIKDYLGNVRMVLTEQNDLSIYTASMETAEAPKENALFSNIDNSRMAKPVGYPEDQTTPQNEFVAKLNAKDGGKKIGPSLVLRVMAGDTIQIGAKAFYKSQSPQENKKPVPVEDMLTSLVQAFNGGADREQSHTVALGEPTSPFASNFTSSDYQRLQQKDPDQFKQDKPKAYLNFVLFDDQFNLVEENSGVKQVQGEPDQLQTLAKDKMAIQKSGFLYVYTSNESPQDVFFDNVTVAQISGPVLEETHYYPFGLTMTGISSNALRGTNYRENRLKYNGKELQSKEFGDGSGLEWYDYGARMYDQQIGRWHSPDNKSELYFGTSPYVYTLNQPINAVDPDGNIVIFINGMYGASGGGTPKYWKLNSSKRVSSAYYGSNSFGIPVVKNEIETKEVFAFDEAVMNHLGDKKSLYRDGSLGGAFGGIFSSDTDPTTRYWGGWAQGTKDAKTIIDNLERDRNGNITESIKIISHSMGGAYAKGYAKALLRYISQNKIDGAKIAFEADFAPFQPEDQNAVIDANMGSTLQYSHDNDRVAGRNKIHGAVQMNTSTDKAQGHSIFGFIQQIATLPVGNYRIVNGQIIKEN